MPNFYETTTQFIVQHAYDDVRIIQAAQLPLLILPDETAFVNAKLIMHADRAGGVHDIHSLASTRFIVSMPSILGQDQSQAVAAVVLMPGAPGCGIGLLTDPESQLRGSTLTNALGSWTEINRRFPNVLGIVYTPNDSGLKTALTAFRTCNTAAFASAMGLVGLQQHMTDLLERAPVPHP